MFSPSQRNSYWHSTAVAYIRLDKLLSGSIVHAAALEQDEATFASSYFGSSMYVFQSL